MEGPDFGEAMPFYDREGGFEGFESADTRYLVYSKATDDKESGRWI
jgi:hypothetical protein